MAHWLTTRPENCEFFTAKDDYITVVTAKEPSGKFKAIAVHTSGQERDALMASEPCDSVLEAMASLHLKTTEAVQVGSIRCSLLPLLA